MRSYLSVDDAVSAIFHVLVKAPRNEAYNVANEQTYCSIYEMANLVADKLTNTSNNSEVSYSKLESFTTTLHKVRRK